MVEKSSKNILYLIIPCFNEEECFKISSEKILKKMQSLIALDKISKDSKILYINDGSTDTTLSLIKEEKNSNNITEYISLSRNFGQQKAILSGLYYARKLADITITIDCDLQDDIEVIDKFLDEYEKGNEIVFGVRNSRKTDTWFKRNSALLFYKVMKGLGTNIVYNHSECRLMGKKSMNALFKYSETNIFLRGVIKDLGFKTSIVLFDREKRISGKSKYNVGKMYELAKEGILSFSTKPLRIITKTGVIIFLLSIMYLIYAVVGYFLRKKCSRLDNSCLSNMSFRGYADDMHRNNW